MKKVINCNQDNNPLINKKAKEVSVEEGLAIAEELFQILNKRGDGIGLAANQVGIDAQVAVVNVTEPLVLINPKYIKKEVEIMYGEGCLSYPGQAIKTKRYRDVIIKTAQSESGWYFSGAEIPADESRGSWEIERKKKDSELRLLEAVCVQHEIDHLNGITIHDREIKLEPTKSEKKIGRNQLVTIKKGDAVKVLKYKKAQNLLNQGWVME
jgi:peptide deformylase